MRHFPRLDANQRAVVDTLRRNGISVQSLAAVGNGCPDLLCATADRTILLEVKDGSKPPSARELTPAQKKWHASWRGAKAVVTCPSEALDCCLGMPTRAPSDATKVMRGNSGPAWDRDGRVGAHQLHVGPRVK